MIYINIVASITGFLIQNSLKTYTGVNHSSCSCNEYQVCNIIIFPWLVFQCITLTALNKGPGENSLSAAQATRAPFRVNVPSDQNIISLLEGQVPLSAASKVILGHHPLHTSLWHLVHTQDKKSWHLKCLSVTKLS